METVYTWHGKWDDGAGGFQEFFEGLPARDLDAGDIAGLDDAQKALLDSPGGQRLYHRVKQATVKRASTADDAE